MLFSSRLARFRKAYMKAYLKLTVQLPKLNSASLFSRSTVVRLLPRAALRPRAAATPNIAPPHPRDSDSLHDFAAATAEGASEAGRRAPPRYQCPACGIKCFRAVVLHRHLHRCCPDLLETGDRGNRKESLEEWLTAAWFLAAYEKELLQQEQALNVAFRQRSDDGAPLRLGPPGVAAALGLSLPRAERVLKAAMRAVPLAADFQPVESCYEDDDLLAVNKPAGIITAPKHRYTGGSIVNRIIGTRDFAPHVVHRLDMNTTGVVVFAKHRDIVPHLHLQFRNKTTRKQYFAIVAGIPSFSTLEVDAPIGQSEDEKVARAVSPTGKPALTRFEVLATSSSADLREGQPGLLALPGELPLEGAALVRCEPLTGRTHQIRVHLAHAGHPIVGDDLYGVVGPWIGRQALHAASLALVHPRSGASLTVTAPLPGDFAAALESLGLGGSGIA